MRRKTLSRLSLGFGSGLLILNFSLPAFSAKTFSHSPKVISVGGTIFTHTDGITSQNTTYMPLWYAMQAMNQIGIKSSWSGSTLSLTTSQNVSVNTSNIPVTRGAASIVVNGHPVYHVQPLADIDKSDDVLTTYFPIWYLQQTLMRLGIHSSWDGQSWNVSSSDEVSPTVQRSHASWTARLMGPSAYIDTSFHEGANWMQIAQQVHSQGFSTVHLIVLDLDEDQTPIIAAFHTYHVSVILSIYPTTNLTAYNQHPDWRQISLGGLSRFDWRTYLSPSNPQFVSWMNAQVSRELHQYPYDGFELVEPWLEAWGGPYKSNPNHKYYMDISQSAVNAFQAKYGFNPLSRLFRRDSDGTYYLNPAMAHSKEYLEWQNFRVTTVDTFLAGLMTTAKKSRPSITTFATYLTDVGSNGKPNLSAVREFQAQDLSSLQSSVKPDVLILQTPWQDWIQPNLQPNYAARYAKAYLSRIHSGTKVLMQTDVGSVVKRNMGWLKQFSADTKRDGFNGYVIYSWDVAPWNTGE